MKFPMKVAVDTRTVDVDEFIRQCAARGVVVVAREDAIPGALVMLTLDKPGDKGERR